jgi:hypothetical protein
MRKRREKKRKRGKKNVTEGTNHNDMGYRFQRFTSVGQHAQQDSCGEVGQTRVGGNLVLHSNAITHLITALTQRKRRREEKDRRGRRGRSSSEQEKKEKKA